VIDPFAAKVRGEDLGVNNVEPPLDIEEERGDFATRVRRDTSKSAETRWTAFQTE